MFLATVGQREAIDFWATLYINNERSSNHEVVSHRIGIFINQKQRWRYRYIGYIVICINDRLVKVLVHCNQKFPLYDMVQYVCGMVHTYCTCIMSMYCMYSTVHYSLLCRVSASITLQYDAGHLIMTAILFLCKHLFKRLN